MGAVVRFAPAAAASRTGASGDLLLTISVTIICVLRRIGGMGVQSGCACVGGFRAIEGGWYWRRRFLSGWTTAAAAAAPTSPALLSARRRDRLFSTVLTWGSGDRLDWLLLVFLDRLGH